MPINFNDMSDQFSRSVENLEKNLETTLNEYDPKTATSADMIKMQMALQQWTMATQLQSNALKTIGDGLKNTVSNMR